MDGISYYILKLALHVSRNLLVKHKYIHIITNAVCVCVLLCVCASVCLYRNV